MSLEKIKLMRTIENDIKKTKSYNLNKSNYNEETLQK